MVFVCWIIILALLDFTDLVCVFERLIEIDGERKIKVKGLADVCSYLLKEKF